MIDISLSQESEVPSLQPHTDPFPGRIIDKYRIEHRIGRGGMGSVYRARHTMFDRLVAVKILSSDLVADPVTFERFRREADACARLKHVNVVGVMDFGQTADGLAYLVMEYVDGQSLRRILDRVKTLGPVQVSALMKQICAAVHAAHRKGIVHRDLKPDNVMVEINDGEEVVKVLDFGIAKLRDLTTGNSLQSEAGSLVGTPQYMSPEQCDGSHLDTRSDVYSLAVMAYEMLAGRVPFTGKPAAVMVQHVTKDPTPVGTLVQNLPTAFADAVMRGLSKNPEERQASAAELATEFEAALKTPSTGESADPSPIQAEESARSESNLRLSVLEPLDRGSSTAVTLPITPSLPPTEPLPPAVARESEAVPRPASETPPRNRKVIPHPTSVHAVSGRTGKTAALPRSNPRETVQGMFRRAAQIAVAATVLYIVAAFAMHRSTQTKLDAELGGCVREVDSNLAGLRPRLKQVVQSRGIAVEDRDLRIKIDPPNRQVTVEVDYTIPLLTIPMRYHVEQTIRNVSLPIEEVARVPASDVEVVNISKTELDNYRLEKSRRAALDNPPLPASPSPDGDETRLK